MPKPLGTYALISSTTLTTTTTTVTFSSIPATYTDLILVANSQDTRTGGNDCNIYFNNDTGSNYSLTFLRGNGSSGSCGRTTNQVSINIGPNVGSNQGYYSSNVAHIMDYTNTATNKTVIARGDHAGAVTVLTIGLWRSTSAINRIDIFPGSGYSFTTGTRFKLYGITAGNQ